MDYIKILKTFKELSCMNCQNCSLDFVELMLESWNFFHKNSCVNKDNQTNFVNYKITFQRFEKNYRRCGCKKEKII